MRAAFDHRQLAVAVGQRLGGAADALLGPRCLGQRAVGVEGNRLARGVDLAGFLLVAADRRVRQPGIMRHHRVRIVIEDAADDFLGDVHVDQAGSQRYLYRTSQSAW
jgi:hypothetical protein